MIRVFAALFPSDEAKEHLVTALRPIRDFSRQEIRWTDPDNWHLTLAFYGDQPNEASAIRAHLVQIAAFRPPLSLHLSGAGAFENRTLWTGVGGDTDNLRTLMAESADPTVDVRPRQREKYLLWRGFPVEALDAVARERDRGAVENAEGENEDGGGNDNRHHDEFAQGAAYSAPFSRRSCE